MAFYESSINLIAKNLRNDEYFKEVSSIIDEVVSDYMDEISDVKYKFSDPSKLREETIKQIVEEKGFYYVRGLMDTLENVQFNVLIDFVAILNIFKGTDRGLNIVFKLLGLETVITEWWDAAILGEEMTFELTVVVTSSIVPDIDETLKQVRIFVQHYVIPKLEKVEFQFVLGPFLEQNIAIGGFVRRKVFGNIIGRF